MVSKTEQKNHRRTSWDSKMSVSSTGTDRCRNFRRSPSSILSSDSDIRFTRKKLTSQARCGCLIVAFFLLFLLLGAVTVYVGYTYFLPQLQTEQAYRGTFRVTEGDTFSADLADPSTKNFKKLSKDYKERLNQLFRRSYVQHGYLGSEVLALDGTEGKDLIVYFDVKIDPSYVHITQEDLQSILANEISVGSSSLIFRNLTIDLSSLDVAHGDVLPSVYTTTVPTTIVTEAISHSPAVPRQCMPVQLKYCASLGYNATSYPNVLQHRNIKDVREHVIAFRELVDAECYRNAYEFVCQILQPQCKRTPLNNSPTVSNEPVDDLMILPCRSFCREFMSGCGNRLSEKLKEFFDCAKFPEYIGDGSCNPKPGCAAELQSKELGSRLCDGIADCQDLSDEKTCTYCPYGQIHCGIGRTCINQSQKCDAREDCPDGSDERGCLNLLPHIKNQTAPKNPTPHHTPYFSEGYVTFFEKGETGKLCTEHLNRSLSINRTEKVLRTVADSLCKTLTYQGATDIRVEKDPEDDVTYVKMKDPLAPEIKFIRTKCPSKMILKVQCDELVCGIQNTHNSKMTRSLSKMATHGDWPWHVALFKEDVHICDGTLLSQNWVATTTSCFQGQPKAEWTVRLGTIRLLSSSPWEQERRIVGMVKSPVEGSTVALVRLDQPVLYHDMVRPVCLPQENMALTPAVQCNTLGWAKNRDHLQRVQLKTIGMDKCENVSISNANSLCAETIYGENDCNEEEFAGSSIVCRIPNSNQWTLVGVTNWRIACDKNGMDRPRMYDKISSNVNWIRDTISSSN